MAQIYRGGVLVGNNLYTPWVLLMCRSDWAPCIAYLLPDPAALRLYDAGANVNCRRSDFLTPLHIVVKHNDVDLIQLLCDQPSVDIESKTMYESSDRSNRRAIRQGLTSLHVAASLGHNEALRKLLENGAMVNCRDRFKRCPLHYVALRNDTKNASVLLKYNANANVRDIFHESPVSSSVKGTPHLPMIQLLLKHGATVESSAEHYTLGLLLETVLSTRLLSDMSVLDLLFQKADVNTTDFIGLRTPMHIAAMTGNFLLAVYLIEKGADPNRKNRAGFTPIDVALKLKNFQIADLLVRAANSG
ncbi:transient receptor potential cation channel subfamily A member 1 [Lasioglossum baleicum]|uniref:transient receptor potential cation channel subfamily A member 1 n=1 Tax=Lasioglossum baleicum TaxID=434251 RepID=UPI003FCE33DF